MLGGANAAKPRGNTRAREAFPHRVRRRKDDKMRRTFFAVLVVLTTTGIAAAQTSIPSGPDHPGAACPPGSDANAPTVGKDSGRPLGDQLAASKGVICPPAGVDPQMRQRPPEGGAMKVIPPPGAPGGDQSVQPK
jgi:hypothetical protein